MYTLIMNGKLFTINRTITSKNYIFKLNKERKFFFNFIKLKYILPDT